MILAEHLMQRIRSKQVTLPIYRYPGFLPALFLALLSNTGLLLAQEAPLFNVTAYSGILSLNYSAYEDTLANSGRDIKSDQQIWQETLSLNMDAYVYHPNFLTMNLGAGFDNKQMEYNSSAFNNESNDHLNNFSATLNFLPKHLSPFSVYYTKESPTISSGITGDSFEEHEEYGAKITLLEPLLPVFMELFTLRRTDYGISPDRITDSINEQVKLRMQYSYGSKDFIRLTHQNNDRISNSGSLFLPIIEKKSSETSTLIRTKNVFGSRRHQVLTSRIGYNQQKELPESENWFFKPHLRWKHNNDLRSFYRYTSDYTKSLGREVENNNIDAGLAYNKDSLSTGFSAFIHNNKSTGFKFNDIGASYNISDKTAASYGDYTYGYTARLNYRDQTAALNLIPVVGDSYIINSLTPVTITIENIDTTTITVTNSVGQPLTAGTDYIITTMGNQTFIQRNPFSILILDGDTVLIDYSYQTGGTIKYSQLNQTLNASLTLAELYNFYTSFSQHSQDIRGGVAAIQLNSSNELLLGLRIGSHEPIDNMTISGYLETKIHDEDINSYNKQDLSISLALALPARTNLNLNTAWTRTDNENNADADIDNTSLTLYLQTMLGLRTRMSVESRYQQATGAAIDRLTRSNSLRLGWNYRQLSYSAYVQQKVEEQGTFENSRWSIFMQLRRTF